MPLITYKFADRHTEEIEVSDEVAAAFAQLEKYEKKVERKETRRHVSFNLLMENGFDFSVDDTDILDVLDKEEQEKSEWREERFRRRVLDDKKIEIFSLLTFRQADAYFRHKYLHIQIIHSIINYTIIISNNISIVFFYLLVYTIFCFVHLYPQS